MGIFVKARLLFRRLLGLHAALDQGGIPLGERLEEKVEHRPAPVDDAHFALGLLLQDLQKEFEAEVVRWPD
jgi:hypothetical protein